MATLYIRSPLSRDDRLSKHVARVGVISGCRYIGLRSLTAEFCHSLILLCTSGSSSPAYWLYLLSVRDETILLAVS